ncbi:MAG: tetratricopeptide repeat protein [Spirochaetes bacterium]|nr:MAG: tetratricopeptide repeat protein [Spirochaetota bacterium]
MKKKPAILLAVFCSALALFAVPAVPDEKSIPLYEEDGAYWKDLMNDASIAKRNQLYAGFVAYRERLYDLSGESFKASLSANPSLGSIRGISWYFVGKCFFQQGKYTEALEQFALLKPLDMGTFSFIKHCALINSAIACQRMKDITKCREFLQIVISGDADKRYKDAALDVLKAL